MKILHISDTHSHHRQLQDLPAADVIVHFGDFTMVGTEAEVIDFMEWFCALPYKHKVFIAGNHDDCLFGADINGLPENCHYLYGNDVTIEGIKFFGIPMFVEDDISGNYTIKCWRTFLPIPMCLSLISHPISLWMKVQV